MTDRADGKLDIYRQVVLDVRLNALADELLESGSLSAQGVGTRIYRFENVIARRTGAHRLRYSSGVVGDGHCSTRNHCAGRVCHPAGDSPSGHLSREAREDATGSKVQTIKARIWDSLITFIDASSVEPQSLLK